MTREKLKPKEAAFVKNILNGMGKTEAALAAGYSPGGARVSQYQLMQRERVQNALREGAEGKLKCGVAIGAAVLIELAEKSKSDDVRLRAAQAILDRGGMQLVRQSEHHHVVTDRRPVPHRSTRRQAFRPGTSHGPVPHF
jgi:phage terminase small subunit